MLRQKLSILTLILAAAACSRANDDGAANSDAITQSELPITLDTTKMVAATFQQAIDHTAGTTNTATFGQRYWYSTEFATDANSPVILHICGEYDCDASYLQRLADVAKSLHASVVTLEHRYYGTSLPYGDQPTRDQYAYLTIGQALDDIASFVAYSKASLPLKGGWIAAGGSYAGMLAAFVREKHPEAIVGAWASSAPVNMQVSFDGYDVVSSFALGKQCGDLLRFALSEVAPTLADPTAGPAMLNRVFTDPGSKQWISTLTPAEQVDAIEGTFSGTAMDFAQGGTGGPQLCSALAQYATHPIDGMIGLFDPPLVGDDDDDATPPAPTGTPDALGPGGATVVARLTTPGENAADDPTPPPPPPQPLPSWEVDDISWNWQACTQMGFFSVSNPDPTNSIMEPTSPTAVSDNNTQCQQWTGQPVNVDATRAAYYDPIVNGQTTNILFVNGTFDPWSSLGFTDPKNPPPGTTVYVIAQGHHHEELESLTPTSLLGEFEAHKLLHDLAVQWLAAPAPTPAPTPDAGP